MQNVKNTIVDRMLSLVAPHLCCGCGEIGKTLCDNCKYDIINEQYVACVVCGEPQVAGVCSDHRVGFQRAWVVGERRGVLQRLIGNYKFQNMKGAAVSLAKLLDDRLPPLPSDAVLVPIPTAPSHARERGYDHLQLVARHLSSLRSIPIASVLKRVDNTTQHHANRQERFEQVKSAFVIDNALDPALTYVILDDVITTGATIQQAANLLRSAGAQTVWVAAIARQPSTDYPTSVKIAELATRTMER